MTNTKVTQIDIDKCLQEALSHMDGLAPSEATVRNALEVVEAYLIRLKLNVLTRGLEGAEPIPIERLYCDDKGKPRFRVVE